MATGRGGTACGAPVNAAQWLQRCSLPSPNAPASPEQGDKGTPSSRGQWRSGELASAKDGESRCPTVDGSSSGGTSGGLLTSTWGAHHGAEPLPDQRFSTFFFFLFLKTYLVLFAVQNYCLQTH